MGRVIAARLGRLERRRLAGLADLTDEEFGREVERAARAIATDPVVDGEARAQAEAALADAAALWAAAAVGQRVALRLWLAEWQGIAPERAVALALASLTRAEREEMRRAIATELARRAEREVGQE